MSSDLYLRRHCPATGRTIITHHQVWDRERFVESELNQQRDASDGQVITIATITEYRAFAWPKGAS